MTVVPGRADRRAAGRWDRSCPCCKWATTPRVRSACDPIGPGWPIWWWESAWSRWPAPRPDRSPSSRWWRRSWPGGSPQAPGVALVPAAAMGAVLLLVGDVIAQQLLPRQRITRRGGHRHRWAALYLIYLLITQARRKPMNDDSTTTHSQDCRPQTSRSVTKTPRSSPS